MKSPILIRNVNIINEGKNFVADVLIKDGFISDIGKFSQSSGYKIIDGTSKHLFPGIIDAQVHFREPGLTHKGDICTEIKAAVAGGVTSFIDMPNTVPNVLTTEILNEKFRIAAEKSLGNYSFFL
jgi:dihydroorotase